MQEPGLRSIPTLLERSAEELLAEAAVSVTSIGLGSTASAKGEKILVCHATGSASNPWDLIEISVYAQAAHEAHGDVISPDFENDSSNCGGCGIVCDTGYVCESRACAPRTCTNTVLSGNADGSAPVCVDERVTVHVSGDLAYQRASTANCSTGPVELGPVTTGDSIQVVANNGSEDDFACGFESLSPLYLVCLDGNGSSQTLDATGVPDDGEDHPCDEIFYTGTFTAAL